MFMPMPPAALMNSNRKKPVCIFLRRPNAAFLNSLPKKKRAGKSANSFTSATARSKNTAPTSRANSICKARSRSSNSPPLTSPGYKNSKETAHETPKKPEDFDAPFVFFTSGFLSKYETSAAKITNFHATRIAN